MRFWYIVLRLSPALILVCGLFLAVMDAITLGAMPPEFREMMPAGGAFVLLPSVIKGIFTLIAAAAAYWLRRLVEQTFPEVVE
jgi:hypothetical protein